MIELNYPVVYSHSYSEFERQFKTHTCSVDERLITPRQEEALRVARNFFQYREADGSFSPRGEEGLNSVSIVDSSTSICYVLIRVTVIAKPKASQRWKFPVGKTWVNPLGNLTQGFQTELPVFDYPDR